jgi:hypothetical protein
MMAIPPAECEMENTPHSRKETALAQRILSPLHVLARQPSGHDKCEKN